MGFFVSAKRSFYRIYWLWNDLEFAINYYIGKSESQNSSLTMFDNQTKFHLLI
ncbi:hypothetical protein VCR26J2_350245 [Vibrio coralliirubri]|nr:hypothetical protein VCR1J2_20250 [Vibrio coralliirubri]CDT58859.1 hypothetical protein VCR6J2_610097 [Vibrio coralliirubri]CDT68696.1 hypothetical protein VCR26J2_350245 [Vibrio coralliirubri]CDT84663.1 hypothetical protein VCR8J2_240253 [Vibrio coralliirubri]